eukprot:m.141613 g.141613  ORF g.141613 m.141613 type:complete len:98 (-) comp15983_c1_seq2:490-783(-)
MHGLRCHQLKRFRLVCALPILALILVIEDDRFYPRWTALHDVVNLTVLQKGIWHFHQVAVAFVQTWRSFEQCYSSGVWVFKAGSKYNRNAEEKPQAS